MPHPRAVAPSVKKVEETKMVKSKIVVIFILILTILSLVAMGMTNEQQEKKTSPQEGITPQKQKEHSKLYKTYGSGPDLRKQAATSEGDITKEITFGNIFSSGEPNSLPPFLNAITCDADAIVIGTPKSESSQFTENGSFIFTDYEVTVEQVLKDNATAPIQVGSNLIVTRPGGAIKLNGRNIRALIEDFKLFKTGERYVLFLRFIPTTSAYRAFGSGSFQLCNNKVITSGQVPQWGKINNLDNDQGFINDVRAAAATNCDTKLEVLR